MIDLILDDKKKNMIANLYRYSDLSVEVIARQVDSDEEIVQQVIDKLSKEEALVLVIDQGMTNVEKIMSPIVVTLDSTKTPREAAALMAENNIGSVIVTKEGIPFGIVTQSDIVRWAGKWPKLLDTALESVASTPLITANQGTNIEKAAKIMIINEIHKLPIVNGQQLLGIVTITDLAVFLSPSRRPGLALSLLQAITRETKQKPQ